MCDADSSRLRITYECPRPTPMVLMPGDTGVEPVPDPMDFCAWFVAYLDGRRHTFDARHNTPRFGRILMARGRDATGVALSTSFGRTRLVRFTVATDEVLPT
jgi:hypothetical protein